MLLQLVTQIAAICSNQDILWNLNVFCTQLNQSAVPIILNCYAQSYIQMIPLTHEPRQVIIFSFGQKFFGLV